MGRFALLCCVAFLAGCDGIDAAKAKRDVKAKIGNATDVVFSKIRYEGGRVCGVVKGKNLWGREVYERFVWTEHATTFDSEVGVYGEEIGGMRLRFHLANIAAPVDLRDLDRMKAGAMLNRCFFEIAYSRCAGEPASAEPKFQECGALEAMVDEYDAR